MSTRITVHAKPGARKSGVKSASFAEAIELHVAIAAPPIEGRANDELVRFLAKALGVKQRDVVVVSGESSRTKIVEIDLARTELEARLRALATI